MSLNYNNIITYLNTLDLLYMEEAYINVVEKEKVAEIEFFNSKSNALSAAMLYELADEINLLGVRDDINLIVIKSKGAVFCAGAYFDELLAVKTEKDGEAFFQGFAKVILAIKSAKAIVLSKVQGKAIGGGVGIIAASDYVIAVQEAAIRLSELTIGIGPFVISPVIKSKISTASFMHLALNPKNWFNSDWMFQKGLVNDVVQSVDFDAFVSEKIKEFASYNSEAIHQLKKTSLQNGLEAEMNGLAKISGSLVTGEETKNILKEFLKK